MCSTRTTKVRLKSRKMESSHVMTDRSTSTSGIFIKDILSREEIVVTHRGTELMTSDYLSKPLQGGLFRRLRDTIMGLIPFPPEDHVGDNRIMAGVNNDLLRGNKSKTPNENNEDVTAEVLTDDDCEKDTKVNTCRSQIGDVFSDLRVCNDGAPNGPVGTYADVLKSSLKMTSSEKRVRMQGT